MLTVTNASGFGSGGGTVFKALGVNFDGTNDYIQRGAGFVGESDKAASWTQVQWVKSAEDGSEKEIHQGVGGCWDFLKRPTNMLQCYSIGPGCSGYRNTVFADTALVIASGWVCIMASSDGSTNQLYFGDTDVTSSQATSTSTESHTFNSTWGAAGNGSAKWNGDLAELYIDFDNRTDFSVQANRRKFFGADGKPVDLGDDGSNPSGASPACYLSVRDGDAATALLTNRGTGGDYTETGSLSLSSTNPGD